MLLLRRGVCRNQIVPLPEMQAFRLRRGDQAQVELQSEARNGGPTAITDAKRRYPAGVIQYRQMGYWDPAGCLQVN